MIGCNSSVTYIFIIFLPSFIRQNFMRIIFFNELSIEFASNVNRTHKNTEIIKVKDYDDILAISKNLKNDELKTNILFFGYNSDEMFTDFCSSFKFIEAAGGVVKNYNSNFLFIKRFGIWDLPKGKVESGETVQKAAVREVIEETGLHKVNITNSLPDTYHIYEQKEKWYLKKTYWYLMETMDEITLTPQTNEAITEAVWMTKGEAKEAISKSYRSLYETLGYLF